MKRAAPALEVIAALVFCVCAGCEGGTVVSTDAASGDGGGMDARIDAGGLDAARSDAPIGPIDPCANGFDDDEDGTIDEDCSCTLDATQACYGGTRVTRGVGRCADGRQTCTREGSIEFGSWGACTGDTQPTDESCDELDNDCDGAADEGCACVSGDVRPCATELTPPPCRPGTQTCVAGEWSSCVDAVRPTDDLCDGVDNDCEPTTPDGWDEPSFGTACDGSDGDLCMEDALGCDGVALGCVDRGGDVVEVCGGGDEDCDGATDEGCCVPSPELCDGVDNDCDLTSLDGADEVMLGVACDGADDDECEEGTWRCSAGSFACSDATGATVEACGGGDEDCDGATDEAPGTCSCGTACADIVQIAAGNEHTCFLSGAGTIRCVGDNDYGQLGTGDYFSHATPTLVVGITNAVQVTAGLFHTCARLADTTVRCWGWNQDGQLGVGDTTNRISPAAIPSFMNITFISAGAKHTCAVNTAGTVRCWGLNDHGQLGINNRDTRLIPTAVPGLTMVERVRAGASFTCVRRNDGGLRCWGRNDYGQLGLGDTTERITPFSVTGIANVVDIYPSGSGFSSCARVTSGQLYCWGWNMDGDLGLGDTSAGHTTPTAVPGMSSVTEATMAAHTTCAVVGGALQCWGRNTHGELGIGDTSGGHYSPGPVPALSGVTSIAAGQNHVCARLSTGEARCWGDNVAKQCGTGVCASGGTLTTPQLVICD